MWGIWTYKIRGDLDLKKYNVIMLILALLLLGGCGVKTQSLAKTHSPKLVFSDKAYHISLQYPSTWKVNNAYSTPRYEGNDGFFQISALDGEGWSVDLAAKNEVNHILKPYGTKPSISKLVIQGQEARLIIPSDDQPNGMKGTAELIIKSPIPIQISGNKYYYLLLYADKNHIKEIAKSIQFIS